MQGTRVRGGRGSSRLWLALAALAVAFALALVPSNAEAAPAGSVSMNPASSSPDVGDYVSLTIEISGAVDLHEVQLAMTYDPAIVQVVDADAGTPGVQILPGGFPGNASNGAVVENSAAGGVIHYRYELDGAAEATGDGTLATVQFLALSNGTAQIAWGAHLLTDAAGATVTAAATPANIVVGGPAPTVTPGVTDTPGPPAPTSTSAPPTITRTPSPTRTHTPTRTPTVVGPPPESAIEPTATARITVIENSNRGTATPRPRTGAVADQSGRAEGLPSAGNEGPAIPWWRWSFFVAALMLGVAGWFFTFALHHGDREVVLMDRFERNRRKRRR